MNDTQIKIAKFLILTHQRQAPTSDYFKSDGGVSIDKVAAHLGFTKSEVQSEIQGMQVEITSRPGLRPKTLLFDEITAIDQQAIEDALIESQEAFELQENDRVKKDITRAKVLNLIQ